MSSPCGFPIARQSAFYVALKQLRLDAKQIVFSSLVLSPNTDSCFYIPCTFLSSLHLPLSTGSSPAFTTLHGLWPSIYCFPDFESDVYCFPDFGSDVYFLFTTFRTSSPIFNSSLLLSKLQVRRLLLSGLRVRCLLLPYCFPDFKSNVCYFPDFGSDVYFFLVAFRTSSLFTIFLLLSGLRVRCLLSFAFRVLYFLLSRTFLLPNPNSFVLPTTGLCICVILSHTSKARGPVATREAEVFARTRRGASRNPWLHPLIEHAIKAGQAVSTPFRPICSNRERSTKAQITIHNRINRGKHASMGTGTTKERQGPLGRRREQSRRADKRIPDRAPGMPDPQTDKRHLETGLHTPKGYQDQGTEITVVSEHMRTVRTRISSHRGTHARSLRNAAREYPPSRGRAMDAREKESPLTVYDP
ncbi:hypothetical protein CRG98_028738 [Punica granatum]|uniref:Uncharacterized protein n=1 Tax=Punica granatum TaxID=22663 RepID=A0A2I0J3S1_PUNGR|nr:hypothetical protein CRG98_028738 [Punica granatum]